MKSLLFSVLAVVSLLLHMRYNVSHLQYVAYLKKNKYFNAYLIFHLLFFTIILQRTIISKKWATAYT